MALGGDGVTELPQRHGEGNPEALKELMPLVYDELREIARRQMRRDSGGTLQTTALVHEAFLKLSGGRQADWNDRCHFLAVAATAMRQIVVDYARRRQTKKRGGGAKALTLDEGRIAVSGQADLLLAIDQALERLGELDSRLAKVVECRFFGGMTEKEMAGLLSIDERTVRRDWVKARAWLHRELGAA